MWVMWNTLYLIQVTWDTFHSMRRTLDTSDWKLRITLDTSDCAVGFNASNVRSVMFDASKVKYFMRLIWNTLYLMRVMWVTIHLMRITLHPSDWKQALCDPTSSMHIIWNHSMQYVSSMIPFLTEKAQKGSFRVIVLSNSSKVRCIINSHRLRPLFVGKNSTDPAIYY